jgi:hypothetical protein
VLASFIAFSPLQFLTLVEWMSGSSLCAVPPTATPLRRLIRPSNRTAKPILLQPELNDGRSCTQAPAKSGAAQDSAVKTPRG